jgi:hypothetical protein
MPNVMSASSMSNSTTNSLLSSTLTPTQKQQLNVIHVRLCYNLK